MRLLYLFSLLLVLFSCNESKKDKASATNEVLEDFSKMPDSVFLKGFAILDTVQLKPVTEMINELRQIPELQEIGVGDELLSFRLKNGPTMLIRLKEFSSLTKGGTASAAIPSMTILNNKQIEENASNVVGAQRGKNRQNKKAFVLAPYLWYFKSDDDVKVPYSKLKNHRNYKGNVNYKSNETEASQTITIDDYLSFNDFDMVYLSSHGSKTCQVVENSEKSNTCYTFISTGIKFKSSELKNLKNQLSSKNVTGIGLGKEDIYLRPEFFSITYPDINNKLFIFSACELGQHGDVENTFNNIIQNGQLFYWQNIIYSDDASRAFSAFYDRMLLYGENAPTAFKNTPDSLKNNLPSYYLEGPIGKQDTIKTTTYLRMTTQGNAMHIIEPISFMDEKTKKELQEGVVYPFEGILEDDEPEEASFTMEFLGYTVQEMEDKGMTFSLKVDGNTVLDHISFVPDTDPNDDIEVKGGKNEKTTLVTFKGVNLKKDLKKNSSVKLEALFHFSEENYGYQMINVSTGSSDMRIVMKGPDGTINMFFDADNYALKMTHPAENATLYSDEEGFIYMNVPGQGWIKTKMGQMAAMIANVVPMNMDFLALEPTKGSVMHKIAAFAGDITIAKLENEPRAKKISGGIGSEKTVFIADGRVTITFDDKKRLESLVELPSSIRYYYEEQEITIPNAQIFSMPSFQ
ncbi:hypothetical protein SAMN03080594_108117 [Arenibacter palladensis]|uniref:Uncharacterized protein n=1 Tax=Arenibacter palladensis TaxID=237373 RepID=A0A1M5F3R4_9FLAO|nr:hypothetical protein [Arenibacter palladensis]SHF85732.1 hypothetical protein SAMN03080594_108117 [Arenibacter palladensis]